MQFRRLFLAPLTLAWAAQIFWLSTEGFGSDHSKSMLIGLLNLLHLSVSAGTVDFFNSVLRKLAHLLEYAVLSILLYCLFLNCERFVWRIRTAFWCLAAAGLYAATDEFHQLFVHGRGASFLDCLLDMTGASVGMLVVYLLSQVTGGQALLLDSMDRSLREGTAVETGQTRKRPH